LVESDTRSPQSAQLHVHRHRPDRPLRIPRHHDLVPRGSQEGAGESPEEVAAIEGEILPKMIVAGFATVSITSVIVTSIIAGRIGG
jgi:hypothetical protein